MKLEKRAQSASEETAAQIPAAPAAENGRHKPVLLYLVILFAIAFVLMVLLLVCMAVMRKLVGRNVEGGL